jgi:hypothetical protein
MILALNCHSFGPLLNLVSVNVPIWSVDPVSCLISFSRIFGQAFGMQDCPQLLSVSQKWYFNVYYDIDFVFLGCTSSLIYYREDDDLSPEVLYLPIRPLCNRIKSSRVFFAVALSLDPSNYLAKVQGLPFADLKHVGICAADRH